MTEYLLGITGIVLIASVLTNVIPTGKTSSLIKGIVRLCLHLLILSPVYEFFLTRMGEGNDKIFQNYFSEAVIETDGKYIEYCSEKSIAEAESLIKKKIFDEYALQVTVTLFVEDKIPTEDGIEIKRIQIGCKEISENISEEIKKKLYEEFQIDVEIVEGG